MAAKAVLGLTLSEFSSDRLVQILRRQVCIAGCNFQAINRGVIAHHAFVEFAFPFKDPGMGAFPEIPANG